MAQRAKPIDLSRSYLPIDPNTLPETMHGTEGEDRPEKIPPVIPYEGWNFMPTSYGYRSYFGLSAKLNINDFPVPSLRVRELFIFQKSDLSNMLVALTDSGIYTKAGETIGAWTQVIALTATSGVVKEWSYCIIEDVLYVYRQGEATVWECKSPTYVFTPQTPTTLNIFGQLGIFKAGGRLGYWDSADAIAHSAFANKFDVTPNIGTGANIFSITDLIGKVINILQHGDGFIIYGTKSIIGVRKNPNNTFLWQAFSISNSAGIAYRKQACIATPDTMHFAWTSIGLMKIDNFQSEVIAPELYDFLKEAQDPVYLKFMEGRYLAVYLASSDYVDGIVTFYNSVVPPTTITLSETIDLTTTVNEGYLSDKANVVTFMNGVQKNAGHIWAFNEPGGCTPGEAGYCLGKDYPVYKDYFRIINIINGPLSGYAQGDRIDVLLDSDLIEKKVQDAVKNKMQFNANGTLEFLVSDSPFPSAKFYIMNGNTGATTESMEIPAYPLDNTMQIFGERVFLDNNDGNFFSKFNALSEGYNRFAKAWLDRLAERLKQLRDTKIIKNNSSNDTPIAMTSPPPQQLPNAAGVQVAFSTKIEAGKTFLLADPSRNKFTGNAVQSLVTEYGLHDNEIPWAIARAKDYRVLEVLYDCYKRIVNPFFRFTTSAAGGQRLFGFTYPDTPYLSSTESETDVFNKLQAAFDAAQAWVTAQGGGTCFFEISAAAPVVTTRPYADINGNVATDVEAVSSRVRIINSFDGSFVAVTAHTDSLQTEDIMKITDQVVPFIDFAQFCSEPQLIQAMSYPNSYVTFDLFGNATASATVSPYAGITLDRYNLLADTTRNAALNNSICITTPTEPESAFPQYNTLVMNNERMKAVPLTYKLDGISFEFTFHSGAVEFTFPGTTFLLQTGAPVPYDITFQGAFFYDTHLKRWGKMKAAFRELLDFSPLNSTAVGIIPVTNFGMQGALMNPAGEIRLFDMHPTDSYLKFGKVGSFRFGYTTLEQIRTDFRTPCTGELEVETSVDGKFVDLALTKTVTYTSAQSLFEGIGNSGRWHNIAFKKQFDLSYLEFRSWTQSRR